VQHLGVFLPRSCIVVIWEYIKLGSRLANF
jgi:hypothetical protein